MVKENQRCLLSNRCKILYSFGGLLIVNIRQNNLNSHSCVLKVNSCLVKNGVCDGSQIFIAVAALALITCLP